jgi:hypothetical protein
LHYFVSIAGILCDKSIQSPNSIHRKFFNRQQEYVRVSKP